jgi:hypothetical protein
MATLERLDVSATATIVQNKTFQSCSSCEPRRRSEISHATEDKVKKRQANPDRYKVAGGGPVDTGAKTRTEKRRIQRQGHSNLRGRAPGGTKAVGFQKGAVQGNRQVSHKTGKRSGAQKAQSTRYGTEALPTAQPVEGAFGMEPASEEYDEIP